VERERRFECQPKGLAVHHRQRARHADADRARLRIRLGAELRAAPAKQLARRGQLHVHLQADDRFVPFTHVSEYFTTEDTEDTESKRIFSVYQACDSVF